MSLPNAQVTIVAKMILPKVTALPFYLPNVKTQRRGVSVWPAPFPGPTTVRRFHSLVLHYALTSVASDNRLRDTTERTPLLSCNAGGCRAGRDCNPSANAPPPISSHPNVKPTPRPAIRPPPLLPLPRANRTEQDWVRPWQPRMWLQPGRRGDARVALNHGRPS